MPNLVAKQVLENQTIQMGKMLALYNSSSTYRWNKKKEYERVTWYTYDSFAARVAAPIWIMVWMITAGKMGRGLWRVENLSREDDIWKSTGRGPPPP